MVPGEGIWVGVGIALCLAGMGSDACLYWYYRGGDHRHTTGQRWEYEIVSDYRYHIVTSVLPGLLVERRKTFMEMGRQKITEFNEDEGRPLRSATTPEGRRLDVGRIPYRKYSFKGKSCIIQSMRIP
jgi:hypothetical protein